MKKYNVKIGREFAPYISGLRVKDVKMNEDSIEFYTYENELSKLNEEIILEYERVDNTKRFIEKYLISIIGFLLICFALINQAATIREIKFVNQDTYNVEIIDYLEKYYTRILFFKYLNKNIKQINLDIKRDFYEYEWISVEKDGAILWVDAKKIDKEEYYNHENKLGDIISRKDAIIRKYIVQRGKVLVQELQYVKAGETLISGNLLYGSGELFVAPNGIVIGEVMEYVTVTIKKMDIFFERTGNVATKRIISFFNFDLAKKETIFNYYDIEEQVTLNIFNFFKIKTIATYEIKEISEQYVEEDAVTYGISSIRNEFILNKNSEHEKIISISLIKIEENDNEYIMQFLVDKYENIAQFVEMSEQSQN